MTLSRRHFFGLGAGLLSTFFTPVPWLNASTRSSAPKTRSELEQLASVFAYGVASGDPLADRVILWTHVGTEASREDVIWQVAFDPDFEVVIAEGNTFASALNDHTVKIDALLPASGTTYYYRFYAKGIWSMVGRTKTAAQNADNLRLAVVSCSSIWSGYMNAYRCIAERDDLDLLIHCGDYIYDLVDKNELRNIPHDPLDSETLHDLTSHRRRFRYYRKDPFLRRAHQQHPWAIVWDNHDIWTLATRSEAIQAFHEWTPIRAPNPFDPNVIYRGLDFGSLARILLLDTRHIGRDSNAKIEGSDAPSMLGEDQFRWLSQRLESSGADYNILVNQVLMARLDLLKIPLIKKSWASYDAERQRVYSLLQKTTRGSNIVLTGDLHISFAADLELEQKPVAVEFLPTSITRGNLDESLGSFLAKWGSKLALPLIKKENPHIRFFEGTRHGYGLVNLSRSKATLELWHVPHEEQSTAEVRAFVGTIAQGTQGLEIAPLEPIARGVKAQAAPVEPRLYSKGEEFGGLKGNYFDSEERLNLRSRLSTVYLYGLTKLKGMEWIYEDGSRLSAGSLSGWSQSYTLQENEYFLELGVGLNTGGANAQVEAIELKTNHGGLLAFGTLENNVLRSKAEPSRHIVGFYGREKGDIFKIGPVFAQDFEIPS